MQCQKEQRGNKITQTAGSSNGKLRLRCQIDKPLCTNIFYLAAATATKGFFLLKSIVFMNWR